MKPEELVSKPYLFWTTKFVGEGVDVREDVLLDVGDADTEAVALLEELLEDVLVADEVIVFDGVGVATMQTLTLSM